MTIDFLLYGANGYTGHLIARQAVKQGLWPLLAGRTATNLAPIAAELGPGRVYGEKTIEAIVPIVWGNDQNK